MRICKEHWSMMRDAIDQFGLSSLVAKDGVAVMNNIVSDINQEPDPKHERFDPLMSMHWHFTNNALQCGGLYLLSPQENGEPYCPVCEFQKNMVGFIAKPQIDKVAAEMATWCREQGLIPLAS